MVRRSFPRFLFYHEFFDAFVSAGYICRERVIAGELISKKGYNKKMSRLLSAETYWEKMGINPD